MRTELARGNWTRPAPGLIFTRHDPMTRLDWAAAGVALGGDGAALTGWDAARLRGVGDSEPPAVPITVLTRTGRNRLVGNVRLSRTTRPYAVTHLPPDEPIAPWLPYVGAARAVADAACAETSPSRVQALVSRSLQKRICTLDQLAQEYRDGPRRGSAFLRQALGDAADGARSAAESAALRKLKSAVIPEYALNVAVVVAGRTRWELDVLVRCLRLVLEIDGREYHFAQQDWIATMTRHSELTALGLAVVHFAPGGLVRDPPPLEFS